jgi:hypothetical protein
MPDNLADRLKSERVPFPGPAAAAATFARRL